MRSLIFISAQMELNSRSLTHLSGGFPKICPGYSKMKAKFINQIKAGLDRVRTLAFSLAPPSNLQVC